MDRRQMTSVRKKGAWVSGFPSKSGIRPESRLLGEGIEDIFARKNEIIPRT